MGQMTAMCGLDCGQCEAYMATQANDEAAKERIAAQWRAQYGNPAADAAYVTCDGCLTVGGRTGGHAAVCSIRACGVRREVPTCAHCAEYETCADLASFLGFAPSLRGTLEEIRRTL